MKMAYCSHLPQPQCHVGPSSTVGYVLNKQAVLHPTGHCLLYSFIDLAIER